MKFLYLPAPSTDFIFAIIGEEWGLVGTLDGGRAVRRHRLPGLPDRDHRAGHVLRAAWPAASRPGSSCQAFINMMVVTALMPVTGIPLPFISAGGSALTINLAAVGILLSISRETTPDRIPARCGIRYRAAGQAGTSTPRWPSHGPCATSDPTLSWTTSAASAASSAGSWPATRCAASSRTTSSSSARCARRALSVHTVLDPARLAASVPQAWWLLGRLRPAALFTTGGYLALPLVLAARARGVPTLVWEGNVQPGRATRAIGRFATRVAVSFPPTLDAFPGNSFVSGTPIRSFAGIDREAARQRVRRRAGRPAAARLRRLAGRDAPERRGHRGAAPSCCPTGTSSTSPATTGMADAGAARQRLPDRAPLALRCRAVPDRSHGRCARRRRSRRRPRRLVHLRRAGRGRRGLDPRAVSVCRRPPALQRRLPRRRGRRDRRRRRGAHRRAAGGRGARARATTDRRRGDGRPPRAGSAGRTPPARWRRS